MRLGTVRLGGTTTAARFEDTGAVPIDGFLDVGQLLQVDDWRDLAAAAPGEAISIDDGSLAAPVLSPGKVICAGLNYRSHIVEMGRDVPTYPTLFAKFADTLTGPHDPIALPHEDPSTDWEGELAFIVGKTAYRVAESEAAAHIAGYTVANDISMRGWQNRTNEWLQGKIWSRTTPVGPLMVTADAFDPAAATLTTTINGAQVQRHSIADLVFSAEALLSYISTMIPLRPGDLVLTGTPGGVGHAREPRQYLRVGDRVTVTVDGVGAISNTMVSDTEVIT